MQNAQKSSWFGAVVTLLFMLLLAMPLRAADVNLAWDASPDDIEGYKLYWGVQSGVYDDSVTLTNVLTATATGLLPGVEYFFIVTAYNAFGESGPSNEVNWTTPGTDLIVRTLMATNLSPDSVTLVGLVDNLPDEFSAYFEWAEGTNLLGDTADLFPAQVVYTNAESLSILADLPIARSSYTYRLVVTNAAYRFVSTPVTFSTMPPAPVQIRFKVHVIQTSKIGGSSTWKDVLVAEVPVPYPGGADEDQFFAARMTWDIDYDHDLEVPPSLRQIEARERFSTQQTAPLQMSR